MGDASLLCCSLVCEGCGAAAVPAPKTARGRQIDATDRQACPDAGRMDQLVYELYGLTDDEIRIVEEI